MFGNFFKEKPKVMVPAPYMNCERLKIYTVPVDKFPYNKTKEIYGLEIVPGLMFPQYKHYVNAFSAEPMKVDDALSRKIDPNNPREINRKYLCNEYVLSEQNTDFLSFVFNDYYYTSNGNIGPHHPFLVHVSKNKADVYTEFEPEGCNASYYPFENRSLKRSCYSEFIKSFDIKRVLVHQWHEEDWMDKYDFDNTVLLELQKGQRRYVFIGFDVIISFRPKAEIVSYQSYTGYNGFPYPEAIDALGNHYLFMTDIAETNDEYFGGYHIMMMKKEGIDKGYNPFRYFDDEFKRSDEELMVPINYKILYKLPPRITDEEWWYQRWG